MLICSKLLQRLLKSELCLTLHESLGADHLTCREGYCFLFRSEIFFLTTRELEYLFCLSHKARHFFPEFNIRLYDKNSESDLFPPQHWESEYFFRKKTITLQVKWSFPYVNTACIRPILITFSVLTKVNSRSSLWAEKGNEFKSRLYKCFAARDKFPDSLFPRVWTYELVSPRLG